LLPHCMDDAHPRTSSATVHCNYSQLLSPPRTFRLGTRGSRRKVGDQTFASIVIKVTVGRASQGKGRGLKCQRRREFRRASSALRREHVCECAAYILRPSNLANSDSITARTLPS